MMKVKQRIVQIRLQLLDALANIFAHSHWYFSDERHNPYRCPHCGSTDIHIRAWVEVNRGNRYVGDCDDYDNDWCESCEKTVHAYTTEWFEQEVNMWWSQTDPPTMERIKLVTARTTLPPKTPTIKISRTLAMTCGINSPLKKRYLFGIKINSAI